MTEQTPSPVDPATVGALSSPDVVIDSATILARLDALNAQVAVMAEQLAAVDAARARWAELAETLVPVSAASVGTLTDLLAAAEDKGYFMFARQGAAIADHVVTSYSEEDVAALGDNVVTIVDTLKELTQPEVMALLNRTARTIQDVEETPTTPPSALALLRSMRDPQTRRGLGRVLAMLHSIGAQPHEHPESGALRVRHSGTRAHHPAPR